MNAKTQLRLDSTIDGIKTYHYTGKSRPAPGYPQGIPTGRIRRIRESDGEIAEDREMRFDDIAGRSPINRKIGH